MVVEPEPTVDFWGGGGPVSDPGYMSRRIRKFRTDKFDARNKGNFDSCNSCKWLITSRLHELHESNFPFVSRIEFIRSKLLNFSAHVSGSVSRWRGG